MPPNDVQGHGQNGVAPVDASIGDARRVGQAMVKWREHLTPLAPQGFDLERFSSVLVSCFERTPRLLECSFSSLRQAVNAAVELGLELGGVSGEAYLIPYNNKKRVPKVGGGYEEIWVVEAQFMPGYKGYLRVAEESRTFRRIFGNVILPDDIWEDPEVGPNGVTWRHRANTLAEPTYVDIPIVKKTGYGRDAKFEDTTSKIVKIRGAFACAQMAHSREDDIVVVVPAWRIEEIRRRSKAGNEGPWVSDYHEMAVKTAIRALWKRIPKTMQSDRMQKLAQNDQEIELAPLVDGSFGAAPAAAPLPASTADRAQRKTQSVAEKVAARTAPKSEPKAPPSEPTVEHDDDGVYQDPDEGP